MPDTIAELYKTCEGLNKRLHAPAHAAREPGRIMKEPRKYRIAASVVVRDQDGKILLIREGDPRVHGKINLPGGHLEDGESIVDCAARELAEEAGLTVIPSGLLGAYVQGEGINFVFHAHSEVTTTKPGQDILLCQWLTTKEILALPDSDILRPKKLRKIIADILSGCTYSNELICNLELEEWEKLKGEQDAEPDGVTTAG